MQKFIIRVFIFALIGCFLGEIFIRVMKLTSDIPQRKVIESGIQAYIPGQKGYYKKADFQWIVNQYGWLGIADTENDIICSIIGDSYIENIMNPSSCNQGTILKSSFNDIGFFEAGRSGVTFIEGMEITKILDKSIKPKIHLLYVSANDFHESIANKKRHTDRMQIDVESKIIHKGNLKSLGLKKMLYASKLVYYMYLRFPLFVKKQNIGEVLEKVQKKEVFDKSIFDKLFNYCQTNYEVERIVLVFHPGTDPQISTLAKEYGFHTVVLNSDNDPKSWALGEHDGHWSCYGHNQVALQVKSYLNNHLNY